MLKRSVLFLALAASLSGCIVSRVSPDTPALPLPDALPAQAGETVGLPDPWWQIFADPTLDALMEEALAHNPDVAVAAARVDEARALLRITDADRLPFVNIEGSATRSKDPAFLTEDLGQDRHQTLYSVQGVVSYELDLWGRYRRASQAARAQLLSSEFGREATKLSLTGEVARGYFGLIAAVEQLARARDTLVTREESLRLERLRLDAGESDEFTFKRAQAEAAATRIATRQLQLEVVRRTNALGVLLGRSPQELIENAVSTQGIDLPRAVTLPPELPSTILTRRPDINAAEAALVAAAADVGAARAQLFPSITLTGVFGSLSPELDGLFSEPFEAWSAVGGLFQPLFQGGRLRANVARTEALKQQRRAEYARTVQVAFREVLDALRGQALIAEVQAANAEQVAALSRATELAELRYAQGDIAYLELLDVRRSLYQAQIDLVAAQRDALLNTVDLALALGGGLGRNAAPPRTARR
jgi:multidrug efflux system outer membrane protein